MFTEPELRDIIKDKISHDEKLAEQVGGSGHLGYVSYKIDSIGKPERIQIEAGDGWKIIYAYTVIVETEFTYYPDNPPYEYKYKKTNIIDDKRKIISHSQKEALNDPFPI